MTQHQVATIAIVGVNSKSMTDPSPVSGSRPSGWKFIKWALCLLVLYVVGDRARDLWDHDQLRNVQLHAGWLLLAGLVYVLGWLPSIWFWGTLLRASGADLSLSQAA